MSDDFERGAAPEHPYVPNSAQRGRARSAAWGSMLAAFCLWLAFPLWTVWSAYLNFVPIWQYVQYGMSIVLAAFIYKNVHFRTQFGSLPTKIFGALGALAIAALGPALLLYMLEHPWGWS
jgi:hypothetical protein